MYRKDMKFAVDTLLLGLLVALFLMRLTEILSPS